MPRRDINHGELANSWTEHDAQTMNGASVFMCPGVKPKDRQQYLVKNKVIALISSTPAIYLVQNDRWRVCSLFKEQRTVFELFIMSYLMFRLTRVSPWEKQQ